MKINICIILFAFTLHCYSQYDFPVLKGPYLGQALPGKNPEIFALGIISTDENIEVSCTFSPDGQYLFYYSNNNLYWVDSEVFIELKKYLKNRSYEKDLIPIAFPVFCLLW